MRSVARIFVWSLLGAVGFGLLFSFRAGGVSLDEFLRNAFISFTYGALISSSSWTLMEAVSPRVRAWRPAAQWPVMAGTLLLCTIAGSAAASAIFLAGGMFPAAHFFEAFWSGLRIALVISLFTGIGAWSYARLESRLEDARAVADRARLQSLESRIRPHFLFNALNTVAALIPEDPPRAERTLERLTALLRYSLDEGHDGIVPLREELRVVRDYLEIERARFGERLAFDVAVVDARVEALGVPAFSVQTLVENAVKHAIAPRREGGSLRVSASAEGARLTIEVSDDGPGFDESAIKPGHGLDTLRLRLLAQYGDGDGARLAIGDGGRVALTLPAREAAA